MISSKKIVGLFIFSQIFFLGVFGLEANQYIVTSDTTKSCGIFTKGDASQANWLPDSWQAVIKNNTLLTKYKTLESCNQDNSFQCCRDLGYIYTNDKIGIKTLSSERKSAEFLASKKIIENHSLDPDKYQEAFFISRKETMKMIMNMSGKQVNTQCREIFKDVLNDWGCKYIESALDNDFIVSNTLFRPDENISKVEALKLIFQAKGINKRYQTNFWQQDYISSAYYLGFIDEKFSDYNSPATRGWIFEVTAKTYFDFSKN